MSYYCPKTPILLVGMKMDLDKKTIDMNSIDKLVKEIQAVNYVKCSSLTHQGINVVYLQGVSVDWYVPPALAIRLYTIRLYTIRLYVIVP